MSAVNSTGSHYNLKGVNTKLQLTPVRSLDEGNGVGKSKQTAVKQMEDFLFNLFFILK